MKSTLYMLGGSMLQLRRSDCIPDWHASSSWVAAT